MRLYIGDTFWDKVIKLPTKVQKKVVEFQT
jgi:hypothetical protein